jgi:hypothetical protein
VKKFCLMAFALLLCASTARADNVVVDWNIQAASTIGAGARRGPSGIFDFAMVQAAVHDAIQAYDRKYEPYCAEIHHARGSRIAAAAAAAHGVLKGLFPAQAVPLDAAYAASLAKYNVTGNSGVRVGELAAACVLERLEADNVARAAPDTFVGGNGAGDWRPTAIGPTGNPVPMTAGFIATFTPFTFKDPARFRPSQAPPKLTSRAYARDYEEVRALGAKTGSSRTPEQSNIALFFTEGPPGYWNRAMQRLAIDRSLRLGDSARLFALVNLAMADSIIVAWDSKVLFNFWRPITAIREGHLDGNDATIGDATWESFAATPNYPDYTSGANNLAGAAATMLAHVFGTDRVAFTLNSLTIAAPNNVRAYSRFSEAGADVIEARIYMGIHFRFADTVAYRQGTEVANRAFRRFLRPTRDHDD